ncbi:hypothetical protein [Nocardia jiangsuensis]|uniref:Beta-lactamase n=1 Tax=Nocardia jiangsuensis TaxID=1691563 RepID=A0ABV8E1S6_9NOCA
MTFSRTKGLTATAAPRVSAQTGIEVDAPVRTWWPRPPTPRRWRPGLPLCAPRLRRPGQQRARREMPAQSMVLPAAAGATAFGHPGSGGSLGLADAGHGVGFGFVPNLRRTGVARDTRAHDLVAAVCAAL